MKRKYYKYTTLEKIIAKLRKVYNYNCIQTWEGCLGIGSWICLPPDENKYYFIIHEQYQNAWSSTHWMIKCRKLPKQWQKELDNYYIQEEKENANG